MKKDLELIIQDARINGIIAKGYLEVVRSIQQHRAKLVVIAEDVDQEKLTLEIKRLCNIHQTPIISSFNRSDLGRIAGINIKTGFLSIKVVGFSKDSFLKFLKYIAKAKSQ